MRDSVDGFATLQRLLWQALTNLRLQVGSRSAVLAEGQVFDYFNEIRTAIELAQVDAFFVDQYLDADFVTRYLPHVRSGASIRLLGGPKRMSTLLPAVDMLAQQSGRRIEVRSSASVHDRFLFVDRKECYLSGASFKDGARNAPAVLAQIVDAFQPLLTTYEGIWTTVKVERG